MWKFSSTGAGNFVPTPLEVYFLPPHPPNREFVAKTSTHLFKRAQLVIGHPSIFPRRPDDALVLVLNRHRDESLFLQRPDVSANLPIADAEKIGEIFVGSKATSFVVEAVNFDEEHFLHQRKRRRQPNVFWNPDAFEITLRLTHARILSRSQGDLLIRLSPGPTFGTFPQRSNVL